MISSALKTVSAAALIAVGAGAAVAQPAGYIHSHAAGNVIKGPTGGVRTGGTWWIHADAWDSWATLDSHHDDGAYTPPPAHYGPVTAAQSGPALAATSKSEMLTFVRRRLGFLWRLADGWEMGTSFANVRGSTHGVGEAAYANAFTLDPNTYEVGPDDDSTQFCIAFDAGLSITAFSDPDLPDSSARASITGFMDTTHQRDLMTTEPLGRLFTYSWSTSSADPSASLFSFTSNPLLGLDDAAIMSEFMNAVQFDPTDGFTLGTGIVIWSAPIPASPGYIYEVGGETQYHAEAAVPSSGALTLLALAGLIAARRPRG